MEGQATKNTLSSNLVWLWNQIMHAGNDFASTEESVIFSCEFDTKRSAGGKDYAVLKIPRGMSWKLRNDSGNWPQLDVLVSQRQRQKIASSVVRLSAVQYESVVEGQRSEFQPDRQRACRRRKLGQTKCHERIGGSQARNEQFADGDDNASIIATHSWKHPSSSYQLDSIPTKMKHLYRIVF